MPRVDPEDEISDAGDEHLESTVEQDVEAKNQVNGELMDEVENTLGTPAREDAETAKEDEDSDEDSDEEKYEVEAIREHNFINKKPVYYVKWRGYKDTDNTWEPEENVLPGAQDILAAYHHQIGGVPHFSGKPLKKSKSKQSLKRESTEDSPAPIKRQKQTADPNELSAWKPSGQDWESQVAKVETIERDDDTNQIVVFVRWVNGKQTKLSMDLVRRHMPRPMCDFYENHLKFKSADNEPLTPE